MTFTCGLAPGYFMPRLNLAAVLHYGCRCAGSDTPLFRRTGFRPMSGVHSRKKLLLGVNLDHDTYRGEGRHSEGHNTRGEGDHYMIHGVMPVKFWTSFVCSRM